MVWKSDSALVPQSSVGQWWANDMAQNHPGFINAQSVGMALAVEGSDRYVCVILLNE